VGVDVRKASASRRTPNGAGYLVSIVAKEQKGGQEDFAPSNLGSGASGQVGRGMECGLWLRGLPGALFGGGAEFPLAEGLHGVGVELLIDARTN